MSTTPDPMTLWRQAGGGTEDYSPQRYRDLMHEHGLLLRPGDEGYGDAPRSAPCGWPRAGSEGDSGAVPVSPDAGEAQGHSGDPGAALPPCPTPCDDDCELNPDGCHEQHQTHERRGHQPWACEGIRRAILDRAVLMAEGIAGPAAVGLMEDTARRFFAQHVDEVRADERECIALLLDRKRAVYCKPCDGEVCDYSDELAPASELVRGGGDEA